MLKIMNKLLYYFYKKYKTINNKNKSTNTIISFEIENKNYYSRIKIAQGSGFTSYPIFYSSVKKKIISTSNEIDSLLESIISKFNKR